MHLTLDIPEPLYREIEDQAAREHRSLDEVVVDRMERISIEAPVKLGRLSYPLLKSKNPGSLKLGEEGIYEYVEFP
jgi:hypothetical protein